MFTELSQLTKRRQGQLRPPACVGDTEENNTFLLYSTFSWVLLCLILLITQ